MPAGPPIEFPVPTPLDSENAQNSAVTLDHLGVPKWKRRGGGGFQSSSVQMDISFAGVHPTRIYVHINVLQDHQGTATELGFLRSRYQTTFIRPSRATGSL